MNLHLYDTATGDIRKLEQRDEGKLSMYVCGPTVYDLPHIGHGRSVLVYDVLRRYVESRGVEVIHVSNITDIDDKIITRANQEGRPTEAVTAQYEAEWWSALDKLNVLRPHHTPHATEYLDGMVGLIAELIDAGWAYETSDTVYFRPERVSDYPALTKQSIEDMRAGERVEADAEKRSPVDFALWKKAKPGEPSWPSPWGDGRPGWHTECVVMAEDILGDGFDLHTGGQDLVFPHHDNERAQAVALGKQFANHWMHHAFIEQGGEKMSKSLGNFVTLTDMLSRVDQRAYRMLVLRAHYRSPIEVTPDTIADAESALARLDEFARRFPDANTAQADAGVLEAFNQAMDADLDTPKAMAQIFTAVREANAKGDKAQAAAVFAMTAALGLELKTTGDEIDESTQFMVEQRDKARADKDWQAADALRVELEALGWTVKDSPTGTQVHR